MKYKQFNSINHGNNGFRGKLFDWVNETPVGWHFAYQWFGVVSYNHPDKAIRLDTLFYMLSQPEVLAIQLQTSNSVVDQPIPLNHKQET